MLLVELQPAHPECVALIRPDSVPERRQHLALLLVEVVGGHRVRLPERRPPLVGADRVGVHPAARVPDLVVVLDGVLGVVLRVVDALQQLRLEDRFLGAGVHLEAVGEFLPPLGQLSGVPGRLDLGEGAPKDLVLAGHEHGQRRGR